MHFNCVMVARSKHLRHTYELNSLNDTTEHMLYNNSTVEDEGDIMLEYFNDNYKIPQIHLKVEPPFKKQKFLTPREIDLRHVGSRDLLNLYDTVF